MFTDGDNTTIRPKKEIQILLAAARVFTTNSGISMSDMALEAGVGRATLHRYFTTKDDLHEAVIIYALDEFSNVLNEVFTSQDSAEQRLQAFIEAVLAKGETFHFLMTDQKIYQIPAAQQRYDDLLDKLVDIVNHCKEEGLIAKRVDSVWAVYTLDALLYSAWQGVNEGYFKLEDMQQYILDTLFFGFSKPPKNSFINKK